MATAVPDVSVVIPVFNEEANLVDLHAALRDALDGMDRLLEFIYVDDGSTDGSGAVLSALGRADDRIRLMSHDDNAGLSAALRTGFASARGDIVATLDADLQNDPADLPRLFKEREDRGADMICGWRKERNDPWTKRWATRIGNGMRNRLLEESIHDSCCPMKVFRRSVSEHWPVFDGYHRFLPGMTRASGGLVVEIPVAHRRRTAGKSSYGIRNRAWKGWADLRGVRWLRRNAIHASSVDAMETEETP